MLGIRAHRSGDDDFLDGMSPRRLDELHAHRDVLVEGASRLALIGTDAADRRGEVNDHLRTVAGESLVDRVGIEQVTLATRWRSHARTGSTQTINDVVAQETAASRHEDATSRPERFSWHHADEKELAVVINALRPADRSRACRDRANPRGSASATDG